MPESPIELATTQSGGCLLRISGRATMHHSPALQELVKQTLQRDPSTTVAIDLNDCTYLDSTFLGNVFGLYQRYGSGAKPRVKLHAPPQTITLLFGPLKLDKFIRTDSSPAPEPASDWVQLKGTPTDPKEISQHVIDCHRKLAEVESPARAVFKKIADAMEQELARG